MKQYLLAIVTFLCTTIALAQAPNKMSFQTVVRNNLGKLVVNNSIGVRLSILKTSSTGTEVYVETHSKTSNVNGLLTLEVGTGTVTTGTFTAIDWAQGPYFLKTEMDVNGGSNYTITGVTEFVSVPYAMRAEKALKSDTSINSINSVNSVNSKYSDTASHVRILKKGDNVGDMNYWDGTKWVALNAGSQNQALLFCDGKPTWVVGGVCPGKIGGLSCVNATFSSVLIHGKVVSGTRITVPYIGGNAGPYDTRTFNSTGVTGVTATLLAGQFTNGNGTIELQLSGTPSNVGTMVFNLLIGGQSCTLTQTVEAGTLSQMNCVTPLHEGGLILSNEVVGSVVKSKIPYSDGNGGSFASVTMNSTGVLGLVATIQAGNFNSGDGELMVSYSGTPISSGFAMFNLTIGGKSCSFKRMVELKGGLGTLSCSPTNSGSLMKSVSASGVSSSFTYTGGNGGKYNAQQVASSGVTGLTANLNEGSFLSGNGTIVYTITGIPSTEGVASFVINIGGKSCTLTRTVDLAKLSSSIVDVEGNSYSTIQIGTQFWMKSNLKTSKYSDGTVIPNITDNTQWYNLTTGAWAYYNNDAANNAKYGKLYNWYAVSPTTNGNKNVCPTGWHVPTDAEWKVLTDYLGGLSVAGGKMKEVGTASWISPNTDATNVSLFTGLPGGYRTNVGGYNSFGYYGYWWSSSEDNTNDAWFRYLYNYNGNASSYNNFKRLGLSVRCLRD